MRKDTRRFVAWIMVICMLACLMPAYGVQAEESASYTSEVDVTLYVGQSVTYEVNATSASTDIDTGVATVNIGDAQLGTDYTYSGDYVDLASALYTFTYSDTEGGWKISNTTSDGTTVYLNIDNSNNGHPNHTTADVLTLEYDNTDLYFTISNGVFNNSKYRYLCFFTAYNTPYFDEGSYTSGSVAAAQQFLIYSPVTDGSTGSSEIPGYVEVTDAVSLTSGNQYLIVAYRNYNYYVLYPSTSTSGDSEKYTHVAKVLGETRMTITGVAVGETSVVVGDVKYNITVLQPTASGAAELAGGASGRLSITDLDSSFSLAEGYTVEWSVGDTDIAGLYNSSGISTSLIAHTEGRTNVVAKVYDASGNLQAVYLWTVTVTSTYGDGAYALDWTITETVYNGTLYYSVDGGELVEAEPNTTTTDAYGNTIRSYNITYTSKNVANTGFIYFIKPDEGYVVTYVYDEGGNTASQFYGTEIVKDYYTKDDFLAVYSSVTHNGGWYTDVMSNNEWDALISQAIAVGCQAVYWNTRNAANYTEAKFSYINYCDKLPTVAKVITSLTRTVEGVENEIAYKEGETEVKVGDVINYTVTVTTYYEHADIVYSNATLTDAMTSGSGKEATFADNETTKVVTDTLGNSIVQTASSNVAGSYTVKYTVTQEDLDSELLNTVSLGYDYSSGYSTGSYGGTASAACTVNLVSFTPDDIVVDFGLPVTVDYSGTDAHGSYNLTSGTATYGTVTVTNNKVTYTPTAVLTEVDTVTLVNEKNATYTFKVYPATTVYYEEGFADYGTGWNVDAGGKWEGTTTAAYSLEQQSSLAKQSGNTYYNYNYDSTYDSASVTQAKTTTVADSLSFTFTGTGVDIFANCDSGSGMVAIRVADDSGTIKKFLFVDMQNTGTYSTGDGTTAYNTPIASIADLTHGTYTVTIYLVTSGSGSGTDSGFRFDGFRVYDTIDNDKTDTTSDAHTVQTEVYQADDEDYPVYYELRDYVLAGLAIATDSDSTVYASDIAASTASQVYASGSTAGAVVYYDNSATATATTAVKDNGDDETSDAQTLLDDGPKNELYLYPGMMVVFKVDTNREVQIGLRSVTGESVEYSITASTSGTASSNTGDKTISSTMDMFYTLQNKDASGEVTYTITVTGSSGVLSVTDIKVCDCPDETVIGELTEEDLTEALVSVGYASDEEDLTGALTSVADDTEEEEQAEDLTSAADDTEEEEQAEDLASAADDAEEEEQAEVLTSADDDTEEEDATETSNSIDSDADDETTCAAASLEVNLSDYTGTVLATTTVARNGVAGEETILAAADILSAVNVVLPEGYALVSEDDILDQTVVYGESSSLSLQIGRVATLTVTCVKYSGSSRASTVATVTLTKVQTGPGKLAVFTAGEIRAAIPSSCRVLLATSASVNYGTSGSKTIVCY